MTGFNPIDDKFTVNCHGGMLQAFDDREVGIRKVGVLPNHGNVDFLGQRVKMMCHPFPLFKKIGGGAIHFQNIAQALFLQHQWDVVDVGDVVC